MLSKNENKTLNPTLLAKASSPQLVRALLFDQVPLKKLKNEEAETAK